MGNIRRVSLSILLIASLSVVTAGATYIVDAATGTEQEAEAWTPSWDCIEGVAIFAIGIISSMYSPPAVSRWTYIWGNSAAAYGGYKSAKDCTDELRRTNSAAAWCSYGRNLQNDYVWVWPGWWFHQNAYYDRPCGPQYGGQ